MGRFRRLARDYERLHEVQTGLHFVAFAYLLLHRLRPERPDIRVRRRLGGLIPLWP